MNKKNEDIQSVVHGYKVFRPGWTCRGKQYTCPGKFEEEGELEICGHGMRFGENLLDCFNYYNFDSNNKVAEVIAYGQVLREGDKSCTDKLEIVREISWDEVLKLVNHGKNCTGCRNTGDCNTGNRNKSSFNNGCFMTIEPKIMMFNIPSHWTYRDWLISDVRHLLNQIPNNVVEWIHEEDMTDEEKAAYPTYEATGGYLKAFEESESAQIWWDGLPDQDKLTIKSLPNFDADIFEQCTGIKAD